MHDLYNPFENHFETKKYFEFARPRRLDQSQVAVP